MGTPLDSVYEMFIAKLDNEVLTGKESLIYAIFRMALAKAKGTVRHSLLYVLDEPIDDDPVYDGYFNDTLDDDEIDLLALYMKYEWNSRKKQGLVSKREDIGTPDFNRLPGKKESLAVIDSAVKSTLDEIITAEQKFNTYIN